MEDTNFSTDEEINSGGFLLFLIFILLILGNQNTFNNYFEQLDKEASKISDFLDSFTSTAQGLRSTLQTSSDLEL